MSKSIGEMIQAQEKRIIANNPVLDDLHQKFTEFSDRQAELRRWVRYMVQRFCAAVQNINNASDSPDRLLKRGYDAIASDIITEIQLLVLRHEHFVFFISSLALIYKLDNNKITNDVVDEAMAIYDKIVLHELRRCNGE